VAVLVVHLHNKVRKNELTRRKNTFINLYAGVEVSAVVGDDDEEE
jgi:hypothetical protein